MSPRRGLHRALFGADGGLNALRLAVAVVVVLVLARDGWSALDSVAAGLMALGLAIQAAGYVAGGSGYSAPLATAASTAVNAVSVAVIVVATGGFASVLQPLLALSMAVWVFRLGGRSGAAPSLLLIAVYAVGDFATHGMAHLNDVLLATAFNGLILTALLVWAQRIGDARRRVLHVVAHELRNPQACVEAAAGLLARQLDSAGLREDAPGRRTHGTLTRAVQRMSVLMQQSLDALRWYDGDVSLSRVPVDLRQVVEAAAAAQGAASAGGPVDVQWAPAGDPAWVAGDPAQLERAVAILLENAVRFSPEGAAVRVQCRTGAAGIEVSISDLGVGIPPGELGAVFEPLVRGSNLEGRDPGGLGLGLYICRCIVRGHGGRLWATSREGRGTTFHLALPAMGRPRWSLVGSRLHALALRAEPSGVRPPVGRA